MKGKYDGCSTADTIRLLIKKGFYTQQDALIIARRCGNVKGRIILFEDGSRILISELRGRKRRGGRIR